MNVMIVVPGIGGGGAERVATKLANHLAVENKVSLVYWKQDDKVYEVNSSVSLIKIPYNSIVSRVSNVRKIVSNTKVDAIISFSDIPNIISYFAAGKRVRKIFTIHNDLQVRDSQQKHDWKFFAQKYLHAHCCSKVDEVVCVSKGSMESLAKYYRLNKERLKYIYNPVIENVIVSNKQIVNDKLKFMCVGRLTEQKNYPMLIRLAEELSVRNIDFSIDIYGDGEQEPYLKSLINKKNLEGSVTIKGFKEDVLSRMVEYDALLMTSKWEGLPTVLIEALSLGVNIISTDCPSGPREILSDGKYGELVEVDDVQSMANIIESKKFIRNITGLDLHLAQFTARYAGEKYEKLLKNEG